MTEPYRKRILVARILATVITWVCCLILWVACLLGLFLIYWGIGLWPWR